MLNCRDLPSLIGLPNFFYHFEFSLVTQNSYMECFVEPYTCFGRANYKVLRQDPRINDGESNEGVFIFFRRYHDMTDLSTSKI